MPTDSQNNTEVNEENFTATEGGDNAQSTAPTSDFFADFESSLNPTGEDTSEKADVPEDQGTAGADTQGEEGSEGVDPATALREEIARMAAVMASHGITFTEGAGEGTEAEGTEEPPAQTPPPPQKPAPIWGPTVTVSDDDFQASLENKGTFEKILTTVRDQAVERTIQSIPQLVTSMIKQQLYLNELSREFYQANEDLAGVRPFVGVIANEIASKNPGLRPHEVLEKTAVEARKRLQMKTKTDSPPAKTSGVGLPNPGNRQKVTEKNLTGLEKDLADLMKVQ